MASLVLADGREATAGEVAALSERLGLVLEHHPVPTDLAPLLSRPLLDADDTAQVLDRFGPRAPYPSRDLLVLHPERADNAALAGKFARWHTHSGDEVRYILDGDGIFRIVTGEQAVQLRVSAGDFIAVPARVEHSFELGEAQRIKAIRYFSDPAGWVAEFTGRD